MNMLKKAKEIFPKEDVYLAMGGFHMPNMDNQSIKEIMSKFRKEKIKKVAPCHCTGNLAISLFKEEYGDDLFLAVLGRK